MHINCLSTTRLYIVRYRSNAYAGLPLLPSLISQMEPRANIVRVTRPSVFERLYTASALRSQNFTYYQANRSRTQATSRVHRIEDELMKKHVESEARKQQLRDQKEAQVMQALRSSPQINPLSKQIAAAKKTDFVVRPKPKRPSQKSVRSLPPTDMQIPYLQVPVSPTQIPAFSPVIIDTKSPETERPPLMLLSPDSKTSLRLPISSPLGLTAELKRKFAELLVPEDPEPTVPIPVVKQYREKQTQSDPKVPLTAFSAPVKTELLNQLMTDRSPTKRLFYMNSYDRNRYWNRLKEEKLMRQREAKAETELSECTFKPVPRSMSVNRSLNASLPRSKSQGRTSTYTERFQQRKDWRSRASSPQVRPI